MEVEVAAAGNEDDAKLKMAKRGENFRI